MTSRIVIDTNIVVAGLRSRRGAAFRLLSLLGTGAFEHCLSVALLFEYEAAVKRPETGIRLSPQQLDDTLDYIAASAHQQIIHYLWRPALPDPGDDLVLEVAVAGACRTIVTYNVQDFAGSERFGVRPLIPAKFLARVEANR
jgi:putative PIN family toxin of toxin-antitoxin system